MSLWIANAVFTNAVGHVGRRVVDRCSGCRHASVMGIDVVDEDRERRGDRAGGQRRHHAMFGGLAVQPDNTVTGVNLAVDGSVAVVFDLSGSQSQHVDEVGMGCCDVAVDEQRGAACDRRLVGRQAGEKVQ